MVETLNTKIVKDTFDKAYTEEQFKLFIKDLLIGANFEKEQMIQPLPSEYRDFIRSAKRICKYQYESEEYADTKVLDVLVVKLKKTSSIDRARTAQRNFIARYLNGSRNYQKDAALVAFISEDENENISPDWRFSLVQMNYVTKFVETSNGKKKLKTEVELTPAKRFSFLVGANEDTHTAQAQFRTCLDKASKGERITIEDLVQAFDIEKVSKEFFDKYKNLFIKMRDELQRLCNVDPIVKNDFITHNVNIDDFAKKTLGQLVFLYFIQKKGWLGVKKDQDWGSGDKKFLRKLFDKDPEFNANYDNFFNDILEHLFYEALASDRGQAAWFDRLNCRIPFLNGGLFEPVNGYEYQKTDLTIDNSIFKEIFDTFDLYNFTVKEDEPLEKEVAIDPEMLGKVFENLLPENIRKGNGAFYTPREIVHYMCQESLINYLYNKVNIKQVELSPEQKAEQQTLFKKKKIDQLKLTQDVLDEIIPKEDIEHFIKKGGSNYSNRNVKEELPVSISQNANVLDNALAVIKVCDPAIGSGAFPVGMMNEIVRARATLSQYLNQPERPVYELKRNAIENSIYGVDIDPGAVDIAKLRFWLSLVVDEEDIKNIKPLPNLDYKIMQGNSLITSYEGIDFDEIIDEYKPNTQLMMNLWGDKTQDLKLKLKNKQSEFLKTPYATRKIELKHEIEDTILELVKEKLEIKAKEGKINLQEVQEKIRNFAQNTENRTFFPWKLFFSDAFDNGGFDVVIGNPPYISFGLRGASKMTPEEKKFYVQKYSNSAEYKISYYAMFMELAINLLNDKGNTSYIVPDSFLLGRYFSKIRNYILTKCSIKNIMLIKSEVFENATVGQSVVYLFSKYKNKDNIMNLYEVNNKKEIEHTTYKANHYQQSYYDSIVYNRFRMLFTSEDYNLIRKIDSANSTLEIYFRGHTGIRSKIGQKNIISKSADTKFHKKGIISGGQVHKYRIDYDGDYINVNPDILHGGGYDKDIIENEKILIRQTSDKLICSLDNNNLYHLNNVHSFSPISNKCDIKYILAILNSKLIDFYYKKISLEEGRTMAQIDIEVVEKFPIPYIDKSKQEKFTIIVDKIYNLTQAENYINDLKNQNSLKQYENKIDFMIYKLYNLTMDEVKIIDPEFTMSEEEYNNFEL